MGALASDFEQTMQNDKCVAPAVSVSAEVESFQALLNNSGENLRSGRKLCETEHQRYMDFSTEVATLKEMSARELRERQDATRQHIGELQNATKRFGDLKTAVKSMRDF